MSFNLRIREYCRRFTPFLALKLFRMDRKAIPRTVDVTMKEIELQLKEIFDDLEAEVPGVAFHPRSHNHHDYAAISSALSRLLSFALERRPSNVCDGRGVFVSRGKIRARRVACLYPGTIYRPGEAIFFPSISNSFILQCRDGQLIDGNDRGLSKLIFRSCVLRDLSPNVCDLSWLTDRPFNFLCQGQYVNEARDTRGNVQYVDVDIEGWPRSLRKWLPYAEYRLSSVPRPFRVVALVATTDIDTGQELLADYLSR